MKILSIETSCDESAIALVKAGGGKENPHFKILEEAVASQIETHRPWGGVVPGLAKMEHEKNLPLLMADGKWQVADTELVAVTVGPGLDPCLWAGISFTQELSENLEAKLVGANHLEGHLYSFLLAQKTEETRNKKPPYAKASEGGQDTRNLFPAVQLVVSGGHTILVLMESLFEWKIIGQTQDDAAGEAFDKVARMLGLPYPGGPEISRLAEKGDPKSVDFPRPMIRSGDYNLSFSGLKTAVLYHLKENTAQKNGEKMVFEGSEKFKADVAASFQEAAVDILTKKTMKAVKEFSAKSVMLSGGVAANKSLRKRLQEKSNKTGVEFLSAPIKYQTDNAVIIAVASYINHLAGKSYELESEPNLGL